MEADNCACESSARAEAVDSASYMKTLSLIIVTTMLCFTSCGKPDSEKLPALPAGVTIKSQLQTGTSWASMLLNAADLGNLALTPQVFERSVMFSSSVDTHKVCLAYLAPEIQGDGDHGFFLAVEDKAGGVEATLADIKGAGAITWMWSANPVGKVLVFIDDNETAALEMPFRTMLTGEFLPCKYPFASVTANGYNLSFPIIHKQHLKVVLRAKDRQELAGLYYQIAWNALDGTSQIHTFNACEVAGTAPLLRSLASLFTATQSPTPQTARPVTVHLDLPVGAGRPFMETQTNGILQYLEITAPSKKALSDLWIEAYWDGSVKPAVICPLSMFVGVSSECENTRSFSSVLSESVISTRWHMPFGPSSRMLLRNEGNVALKVQVTTLMVSQDDTSSLLRLYANYSKHKYLDLRQPNVLTLVEVPGCGRIVQCTIRVDSNSDKWWGEGDHIIWLDQMADPAWRGTGTEDYFGFAWCSNELFEHPFRAQTRADRSRRNRRIASMHRTHLLDTLPFRRWAKFEMEAWGMGEGLMDYETSIIWYAEGKSTQ